MGKEPGFRSLGSMDSFGGDCMKVLECECGVRSAPYVEAKDLVGKVRAKMNQFETTDLPAVGLPVVGSWDTAEVRALSCFTRTEHRHTHLKSACHRGLGFYFSL